jgi:hypothetical protein
MEQKIRLVVTSYHDRLLILVNNKNNKWCAFYRSSGTSTPDLKLEGEVFPILGILGHGNFGSKFSEYYPDMKKGWIVKFVTNQGRNDLKSYFNSESIKETCLDLEKVFKQDLVTILSFWKYDVRTVPFEKWIELLDKVSLEKGTDFIGNNVLSILKKPTVSK